MNRQHVRWRQELRELWERPRKIAHGFQWRDVAFFWRFARPVWLLGVGSLLLLLGAAALGSLLPLSTKVVIDFVVLGKPAHGVERALERLHLAGYAPAVRQALRSLPHVVAGILTVSLAAGMLALGQQYLALRFQQEVTFNLQTALFEHVLRFPLRVFRERQVGYLMARLSEDVHALQALFSQRVSQLATSVFYLAFGAGIVFALNHRLALMVVALLPLYVLINFFFAGRVRHKARAVMESRATVAGALQETLAGIEVVKSFTGEEHAVRRLAAKLRGVIRSTIRSAVLSLLAGNLVRGVQLLSGLLVVWCGVRDMRRGVMSIGDFVAFNSYLIYLAGPVTALTTFHLGLQPVLASLDRLLEMFRITPERQTPVAATGARLEKVIGRVEFQRVTFAYQEGHPALRDVQLVLEPGEVVALVGPSGAGKTTLAGLILAFHTPTAGRVLLDGHDLCALDVRWLRRQVGFVPQEPWLFADTVRNNILYGRPEATEAEIVAAAQAAQIHDEIVQLPAGYATVIGAGGVGLSLGQKQRLSIARAFLKDPPVLVLDEPTSALDARSEALLKGSLRHLLARRTTLIIAHRLSTIDFADRIVVLDQGAVVAQGPHAGLLETCPLYRSLYEAQTRG